MPFVIYLSVRLNLGALGLQGMNYAMTFNNGPLPPDPSVNHDTSCGTHLEGTVV